jgi:hypothetical protein
VESDEESDAGFIAPEPPEVPPRKGIVGAITRTVLRYVYERYGL